MMRLLILKSEETKGKKYVKYCVPYVFNDLLQPLILQRNPYGNLHRKDVVRPHDFMFVFFSLPPQW